MSQDQPSIGEIMRTAAEFVDAIVGQIDDAERYERWDETFDLVMQHVIDRVKVSKPDYLDPIHRD
jgi:hypothetical protein